MVAAAQNLRNGLSTLITHAAGLQAHELLTIARPDEQPPDRRPARPEKFAGRPGRDYTVIGKGSLVRLVRIPDHLADRLNVGLPSDQCQILSPRESYGMRLTTTESGPNNRVHFSPLQIVYRPARHANLPA